MALATAHLSEAVARATRTEPWLPRQVVYGAREPQRLDSRKAVEELGLPQTPLPEAIERALNWFRQHGYL